MGPKLKTALSFMLRFGLSGILLAYLYTQIDISKTQAVVRTAEMKFLFLGLIFFFVIHVFLFFRWQFLIKGLGLDLALRKVFRFFSIGLFGNLFLPSAIGGDVIKIVGLCNSSDQKPKIVASVLLDRLSGFAGMVFVAIFSFIFGYRLLNDATLLGAIFLMAGGSSTIALVLFNERIYTFCCRIFTPFPRLRNGLMTMHYDIALLKGNMTPVFKAVGMSALGQVVLALTFYCVARALHQEVALIYFLIFVPLICVASCFPSIGGLGVREAGAAFLLGKVGVESGIAVSIGLFHFLYMVLIGILGWGVFMVTKPREN